MTTGFPRTRTHSVRLAESIAADLRRRIINGEMDGDELPKQEDLRRMFAVSGPSLREALRILEVEGLVTVRRGKVGGASFHRPDGASAAHAIGLTLQGQSTRLRDLAEVLLVFEPLCAGDCAATTGKDDSALALLEENLGRSEQALGSGPEFTRLCREFHDLIVDRHSNRAIRMLTRSMVAIWTAQEEGWAIEVADVGRYPDLDAQKAVLAAHRTITRKIATGAVDAAESASRRHLTATQALVLGNWGDRIIDATSPLAMAGFRTLAYARGNAGSSLHVM